MAGDEIGLQYSCQKVLRKNIFMIIFVISPALQTVAQHYISIGAMYRVIWVVAFLTTGETKLFCQGAAAKYTADPQFWSCVVPAL